MGSFGTQRPPRKSTFCFRLPPPLFVFVRLSIIQYYAHISFIPSLLPSYSYFSANKLVLVLDLDHTLLHSVTFGELKSSMLNSLHDRAEAERQRPVEEQMLIRLDDIQVRWCECVSRDWTCGHPRPSRPLFPSFWYVHIPLPLHSPHKCTVQMFTKLRPGVRDFLRQASEKFEMWIHTNGMEWYASRVAEILDPSGNLFGGRIIAQGGTSYEELRDQPKALTRGLETRESIALVIDDSHHVWQAHAGSLIQAERYVYFPIPGKTPRGQSMLERGIDEDAKRGNMMTIWKLVDKAHSAVFRSLERLGKGADDEQHMKNGMFAWDVRVALVGLKEKVLRGVHIVFSHVIRQDMDPKKHELWVMAEAFGAKCSKEMVKGVTTHLVAGDGNTEKASVARSWGLPIVKPEWLIGSCLLWKKLDEKAFTVSSSKMS